MNAGAAVATSGGVSFPATVVGALAGLAVVCLVSWVRSRRMRLSSRIGPFLGPTSKSAPAGPAATLGLLGVDASGLVSPRTPFPTLERLLAPTLAGLAGRLQRLLGGAEVLSRRLQEAGREPDVQDHRTRQVLMAGLGLVLGSAAGVLLVLQRDAPVLLVATAGGVGALGGVMSCDMALTAAVRRRERVLQVELPTVAELLSLAIAAGEGPLGALERVSSRSRGELGNELRRTLGEVRAGVPLVVALEGLSARSSLPELRRFVDAMVVALERGTPLAEVLRAQALDVREASRRSLLEAAGRREIAMMLPIVFLLLPVTVAFALYPGLASLSLQV